MMNAMISRRHFLAAAGATAAGIITRQSSALERANDNIQLGMMLQGASAAELQARAQDIAAVGFDTVQVTFSFQPTVDELKTLARVFKDLKLKTAAFGTYFNLFRPDDMAFMRSSQAVMKCVAAQAALFDCRQFVTWSASYAQKFAGADPRNAAPEAVAHLQRAIREVVLPIIEPIGGRVAFEPFFVHVLGSVELAQAALAPFPASQVGIVLDPPNFIAPALYPQREEITRRQFRELGDRIHLCHFKDMKLNPSEQHVDYPGPGGGEMNYPVLVSQIRGLHRRVPCIIEHIKPEPAAMSKTKAWVEAQLR